jgi:hypothetical protein
MPLPNPEVARRFEEKPMRTQRTLWPIVLLVAILALASTSLAAAQAYSFQTLLVQSRLGIATTRPAAPLHIDYGKAGSMQATTPGGKGPGLLFTAANGRRRDISAWNGGVSIGASDSGSAPPTTLQVCDNGNVGIGMSQCPTQILQVVQNSRTDPRADAWTVYSSQAYKTDIRALSQSDYTAALEAVLGTPLVRYHYKGQAADAKLKLGVLAEQAPEVILAEGDPNAVSLGDYIGLLHAAIVAQQAQLDAQQRQIEALEAALSKK